MILERFRARQIRRQTRLRPMASAQRAAADPAGSGLDPESSLDSIHDLSLPIMRVGPTNRTIAVESRTRFHVERLASRGISKGLTPARDCTQRVVSVPLACLRARALIVHAPRRAGE
jgi:hypothetical protein